MATELEVLRVRLEAMTGKYNKTMKDAAGKTKDATGKIQGAMKKMILRFAAFATAVMVARKAYRAFTSSMSRIDKLAKTADFLGITTEALAGLEHLGNLTGVSMGNLETGLMRMTRALGEAMTGAKEYLEPFQRIGVSVDELVKLKPDEQMARIADGIAGLNTQTEQGSIAMEIFGRSGMRMLNLLRQGEKGFKRAADEAKAFGLGVSRDAARGVENANDALTRAAASAKGFVNFLAVKHADTIKKWANDVQIMTMRLSAGMREEQARAERIAARQEKRHARWVEEGLDIMAVAERYPALLNAYALYLKGKRDLDKEEVDNEKTKQVALNSWTKQGIEQREAGEKMSAGGRAQTMLGQFSDMVGAIDSESRTLFAIGKGLAAAEATVNTYAAVIKTYAMLGGGPWGVAAATAVGALGAAQVAGILATQYQKGGGGAAPAAGGGGAGAGAGAAAQAETPQDVNVVLQGQSPMAFSEAQMREFIGFMDDTLADGTRMRSITISG